MGVKVLKAKTKSKYHQSVKSELISMTRAWDKEKSESLTGIKLMTSRIPGGRSAPGKRLGGHGFDSVGDSDFSSLPRARVMLISSLFTFHYRA